LFIQQDARADATGGAARGRLDNAHRIDYTSDSATARQANQHPRDCGLLVATARRGQLGDCALSGPRCF